MKRLVYCAVIAVLGSFPLPSFSQAIGEMVRIQPKVPAPSLPVNLTPTSGQLTPGHSGASNSSQIITVSKTPYKLPATNPKADTNQPDFTIFGDDPDDGTDLKGSTPIGQPPVPQTTPVKAKSTQPQAQKAATQPPQR